MRFFFQKTNVVFFLFTCVYWLFSYYMLTMFSLVLFNQISFQSLMLFYSNQAGNACILLFFDATFSKHFFPFFTNIECKFGTPAMVMSFLSNRWLWRQIVVSGLKPLALGCLECFRGCFKAFLFSCLYAIFFIYISSRPYALQGPP